MVIGLEAIALFRGVVGEDSHRGSDLDFHAVPREITDQGRDDSPRELVIGIFT
jgi:hypothetical protein